VSVKLIIILLFFLFEYILVYCTFEVLVSLGKNFPNKIEWHAESYS